MSVNALAMALRVPTTRLHEIAKERRAVTPDTALRLARHLGGDAQARPWSSYHATLGLEAAPGGPPRDLLGTTAGIGAVTSKARAAGSKRVKNPT